MVNAHVTISTDPNVRRRHYLHEVPQEDEERLESLFKSLDVDGNGKIDIHDLTEALREFGVHHKFAESFLERADVSKSSDISLMEFVLYIREHEKNLRLGFSHIDKNKDGKIDLEELIKAFKDLGVDVETNEARKLLQRMDQDGNLEISYNEWRDFWLYAPSADIHDLIHYWRHPTYLDIGEGLNVPDDFTENEMITGVWWRTLVSGAVAGAVSRTCTAPLDRVKVYMQVHGCKGIKINQCFNALVKEGGFFSLWRGNGINVIKIAPETALKFWGYEEAKSIIQRFHRSSPSSTGRELNVYERLAAGSMAGVFSQTTIYPLEVLKTRLALRKTGQYKSIFDAVQKIYKTEGIRSFSRGYVPNILGIVPYSGIELATFETLKNNYLRKHEEKRLDGFMSLAFGGTACTFGQICSYPLALIRTKLQAQVIDVNAKQRDTMVSVFKTIIKTEGFPGFYRGITPNSLKVIPAVAINYLVVEKTKQALGIA